MFGYVKAFPPELKVREYESYRAVYCGLCRRLGQTYGPLARLTLSYDFTFLSLLGMALSEESPALIQGRCPANPLKKRRMAQSAVQDFAADCAMIMFYYKVLDDLHDRGARSRLRALLCYPFAAWVHRRAARRAPAVENAVSAATAAQAALEAEACASLDAACHPTAESLGKICALLARDESEARILQRMGYLAGRYVYLCDALDDLEDDLARGNYNPFAAHTAPDDDRIQYAIGSLYLTIGELGATYELLSPGRFAPLLENILYFGMRNTVDTLASKKRSEQR